MNNVQNYYRPLESKRITDELFSLIMYLLNSACYVAMNYKLKGRTSGLIWETLPVFAYKDGVKSWKTHTSEFTVYRPKFEHGTS
jgi:hypothetical protein